MLKIRLMRIGAKKRPFYRIVAVDERAKRTGGYLELLGTYNPLTEPHEIKLKQDRIDALIKQGAKLSDGFLRIIGKAPQRPPRKPKKEQVPKEEKVSEVSKDEKPTEETAKPDAVEAISEVESAHKIEAPVDLDSQQTHSEAQDTNSTDNNSEPSGASRTGEPAPQDQPSQRASEKPKEETKDEGSA